MLSSDDEVLLMYYLYLQTRRKRYRKTKPKSDAKRMRLNDNNEANLEDIDKFTSHLAKELKGMPVQLSTKLRLDIDNLVKNANTGREKYHIETDSDTADDADSSSDTKHMSSASEDSSENEIMAQDPLSINNENGNQHEKKLKTRQAKYQKSRQADNTVLGITKPITIHSETKAINLNIVKEEIEEGIFEPEEYKVNNSGVKREPCIDGDGSTFSGNIPKPMDVPIEIGKSLELDILKEEIENDLFETEDCDVAGETTDTQNLFNYNDTSLNLNIIKEDN